MVKLRECCLTYVIQPLGRFLFSAGAYAIGKDYESARNYVSLQSSLIVFSDPFSAYFAYFFEMRIVGEHTLRFAFNARSSNY